MKTYHYSRYYRKLVEKQLGRKLTALEVVHHKDGDHWNNGLSNLQVMTTKAHAKLHGQQRTRGFLLHKPLWAMEERQPISFLEKLSWYKLREIDFSEIAT
jgi:hypothetical protein